MSVTHVVSISRNALSNNGDGLTRIEPTVWGLMHNTGVTNARFTPALPCSCVVAELVHLCLIAEAWSIG